MTTGMTTTSGTTSGSDTGVWLRHVGLEGEDGHGDAFLCPAGAVDAWRAMGWEPGDPPEEPNPVTAEHVPLQPLQPSVGAAEEGAGRQASRQKRGPRKKQDESTDNTESTAGDTADQDEE